MTDDAVRFIGGPMNGSSLIYSDEKKIGITLAGTLLTSATLDPENNTITAEVITWSYFLKKTEKEELVYIFDGYYKDGEKIDDE